MLKKLQSDHGDLMEIFQQHYAELRRERSEYKDTVHKLECEVAGLQGRVEQLEELNKRLTEERDQFLERYYRLVTQFELIGGGVDRARAGATRLDSCEAGRKSTSRTNSVAAAGEVAQQCQRSA